MQRGKEGKYFFLAELVQRGEIFFSQGRRGGKIFFEIDVPSERNYWLAVGSFYIRRRVAASLRRCARKKYHRSLRGSVLGIQHLAGTMLPPYCRRSRADHFLLIQLKDQRTVADHDVFENGRFLRDGLIFQMIACGCRLFWRRTCFQNEFL